MSVSREQLVQQAGVDDDYVHRLHELRALRGRDDAYKERDVHVAALLYMWERAGLSAPAILAAVDSGTLSLNFLESPAWGLPEPGPHGRSPGRRPRPAHPFGGGAPSGTAGSGKHLEAGFWSDDRALVEHMTRFVEAVISFSEPLGSGTVGPEPDLVSVEYDDEAIAEYLAEWGPEKLSDDY